MAGDRNYIAFTVASEDSYAHPVISHAGETQGRISHFYENRALSEYQVLLADNSTRAGIGTILVLQEGSRKDDGREIAAFIESRRADYAPAVAGSVDMMFMSASSDIARTYGMRAGNVDYEGVTVCGIQSEALVVMLREKGSEYIGDALLASALDRMGEMYTPWRGRERVISTLEAIESLPYTHPVKGEMRAALTVLTFDFNATQEQKDAVKSILDDAGIAHHPVERFGNAQSIEIRAQPEEVLLALSGIKPETVRRMGQGNLIRALENKDISMDDTYIGVKDMQELLTEVDANRTTALQKAGVDISGDDGRTR